MTTNQTSTIVTERVDDIPLLLKQIMQMGIPEILDANFLKEWKLGQFNKFRVDYGNLVSSLTHSSSESLK